MEIGAKNTENTGGVVVRVTNLQMAGVTCHKKNGRGYCHHGGQIVSPNGGKTLETRNQEMSDKSRNRL